jgi:tripeptidyl-peptidase-2
MIQVDKAWAYLLAHKDNPYEDINFVTCVDNRPGKPRGVYLRQPEEVAAKQVFSINVDPKFGNNDNVDLETQQRRVEFEMNVSIQTTAPDWIKVPDLLVLMYNGRSFKVEIDPTNLPPGLHTAHINGHDESSSSDVIFSVPVTVLIPLKQSNTINLGKLTFKPSEVKRFFLDVPTGATWMDVSIRDARCQAVDKDASPRLVVLHCLQLLPHSPYSENEKERMLNLLPGQMSVTSVPVHGGVVCELAIARYWSAVGLTTVEVDVDFRGVSPIKNQLQMFSGGGGVSVRVESLLKDESVSPSASLTKWLTPIRPKTTGLISALGERDVWPTGNKKIYQLLLTYEFDQSEAGSFRPRVPSLQEYLYESAYESQLVMIFDPNKKLIGIADAFRQEEVKTPKGKITLRLQVRHDQPDMLSKLKDQVIWIERKISKEISLSTYASKEAMMTESKAFVKRSLQKGTSLVAFFAEPAADKLPKGSKSGDVLVGTVNYESSDGNLPGSGKRPGGYSIRYVIGPSANGKDDGKGKDPEVPDERNEADKLEEAMLKMKVDHLQKLSTDDKDDTRFEALYDTIVKTQPNHIPLLMVLLNHQDQDRWRSKRLKRIVEVCDDILSKICQSELVNYYGITGYFDKEDGKACKERKEMDQKKDAIIEALARKARAIADMEKENGDSEVESLGTTFDQSLTELRKWVDMTSNNKYAVLSLEKERRMGRPGLVLKLISKPLEKDGEDTKGGICPLSKTDLLNRRAEVLESLGYSHLAENDKMWRLLSSPKEFAPF